ncbi:MAG: UvrD-helicase domain-containing protein [Pseudomonadota bacterium]|nr:UvrD-helicase domain-containing protein [Pseudomonadota bacterium]
MPGSAAYMDADPFYFDGLNPAQRQAVETLDGPLLVLAGAGTGKTRVLTTRLAHLLATGRAAPHQILAMTFTNKAAREMRVRVADMTGRPVEGWWVGTFHSLAARFLRPHAEKIGLTSSFTILDADDQLRLLKRLMDDMNIDKDTLAPKAALSIIERWKDKALGPDGVDELADDKRLPKLYAAYQTFLRESNACDFGDLLMHVVKLLRHDKNLLAITQDRFRYVLVDEYQDTNTAQYLWLRLLAGIDANICCVGDDDQSIYGWRGAEVDNILRFERDFPGAKVVRLERNYRSTGHILGAAAGLIACNADRLGKTLYTDVGDGEPVQVRGFFGGGDEAGWFADEVGNRRAEGLKYGDMAVLVRMGAQTREFEEACLRTGFPYRVIGAARFYERKEIRDAIAYLRVVHQPADNLAFERIVNLPKRGIGEASVARIRTVARALAVPMTEASTRMIDTNDLRPGLRKTLAALLGEFTRWRALDAERGHMIMARDLLESSGLPAMYKIQRTPDAQGRIENLEELVSAMAEFDSLEAFLDHVALVMDNQDNANSDQITIMTLHAAKGLEFDTVFLPGWEEGIFPSARSFGERGTRGLEEERRLAHVGLTRARRRAYVSYAAQRFMYGQIVDALPSIFVGELPEEHIETFHSFSKFAGSGTPVRHFAPQLSTPQEDHAPGNRIFHDKFGYGTIMMAENNKITISFDHSGVKKVMSSFVVPADKDDR